MGIKIKRVLIAHQSTIPHYRVSFYRKMEELRPDWWTFSVVFDEKEIVRQRFFKEPIDPNEINFKIEKTRTYTQRIFGRSLTFQSFIFKAWKYDLIIIGNTLHNISYPLGFFYRLLGKSVAVWWHRRNFHKKNLRGMRKQRENILLKLSKRSSGIFAYTNGVKKYLSEQGISEQKLFVLNNTIDIDENRRVYNALRSQREKIRAEHNLTDKKTLLFVGRLDGTKKLDFLSESIKHLKKLDSSYHLIVVGGGDELLKDSLLRDLGDETVTFHGILTKPEQLAPLYLMSDLYVYPGNVGLGPVQALCFDLVPAVIDSQNHNPEYEYLTDKNSMILPDNTTTERYAEAIESLMNDPKKLNELRSETWNSIKHLTIESMARNFIDGINSILSH